MYFPDIFFAFALYGYYSWRSGTLPSSCCLHNHSSVVKVKSLSQDTSVCVHSSSPCAKRLVFSHAIWVFHTKRIIFQTCASLAIARQDSREKMGQCQPSACSCRILMTKSVCDRWGRLTRALSLSLSLSVPSISISLALCVQLSPIAVSTLLTFFLFQFSLNLHLHSYSLQLSEVNK